ncbi:hypothetical protein CRG98_019926 [Punica granatum]|uniref:Root cap n=1 Tax=Punica granatum TaxID=22663 RepID=A0A2I0JTQ9_PUNGR|nr:hypothetical protein CRG98_019926 [Punica granatum]
MAKLVFFLIVLLSVLSLVVQSSLEPSSREVPVQRSKISCLPGRVRCLFPSFRTCFQVWQVCPPECPFDCVIDCRMCRAVCRCNLPGAVCQDPRFVGGDGNTFYFHGRKDEDFCLASDNDFHVNAHFIGKRNLNLTRDFTWVQSIGVIFACHKLLIAAERTSTWDGKIDHLSLALDDIPANVPTIEGFTWRSPSAPYVSFTWSGPTNGVVVEVKGKFRINADVVPITADESRVHGYNITDDSCFAHLELGFKFYNMSSEGGWSPRANLQARICEHGQGRGGHARHGWHA